MDKIEKIFSIVFTSLGAIFLAILSLLLIHGSFQEVKELILSFSILGVCFFSIGMFVIINYLKRTIRAKKMIKNGFKVIIASQDISTRKINYGNAIAYIIICKWKKTETEFYKFKSEEIGYNPKEFLTNDGIVVYVNKQNHQKYMVDISFLPELAY